MKTQLAIHSTSDLNAMDDSPFPKTVVIYGDVPAGQRAIEVLANIFHQSPDDLEFRPQLWRFELLEDPDGFGVALVDAINADIVVIATSSGQYLNSSVANWINLCLSRKRGTSAAVIALLGLGESEDGSDSTQFQYLQDATRAAGLDFFAPQLTRQENIDLTIEGIRHRADTVTRTLDEILHHVRVGQAATANP